MKKCKVNNCDGKHKAKGYCKKHYDQFRKYGEGLAPVKQTVCSVDGCNNKHYGLGYCDKHYYQYKRCGKILERTTHDKNEIVIYEDYAEIVIYNNKCEEAARALIDIEDINKVAPYKWCLDRKGYIYNAKVGRLHRYLMNPSDNEVVDHKSGNKLDNRKSNLRVCSIQQNSRNKSKQRSNTSSKYKGICWDKHSRKWKAHIKHKHIGLYESEEEGAIAYDKAAIKYFGEFANTNFPIENYIEYILELGLAPSDFGIDKGDEL